MRKACIRVRMSERDVHYGGGIVNMARLLELMADCTTEASIMFTGDEGLLAAYEHIEQYVPVRAGDYIEIVSWVSRKGNTSYDLEIEAYKYAESADGGKTGACNWLEPPVLVCKASLVGVIPKEANRGPQIPEDELPYIPRGEGKRWWEK